MGSEPRVRTRVERAGESRCEGEEGVGDLTGLRRSLFPILVKVHEKVMVC